MKKMFMALMGILLLNSCGMIREIEYDTVNDDGAHVRITSANRLFTGCGLRICEYTPKGGHAQYALVLDIEDRVLRASKGDLMTIHMEDGQKIVLKNLYDAQSEVTERIVTETDTRMYTDYVPVYDGWYDAVYAVPVTSTYRFSRPVVKRESWIELYYIITPEQMQTIMSGEVDYVTIVTDRETIEKSGSDMPYILQGLMELFKQQ